MNGLWIWEASKSINGKIGSYLKRPLYWFLPKDWSLIIIFNYQGWRTSFLFSHHQRPKARHWIRESTSKKAPISLQSTNPQPKPRIIKNWHRITPSLQLTSIIWKRFPASTLPCAKLLASSLPVLKLGCKMMRRKRCKNPTAYSGRLSITARFSSQRSKRLLLMLSTFQTQCGRSLQHKLISPIPAEQTMFPKQKVSDILIMRRASKVLQNWRKSGNQGLLEFKIKKTSILKA